MQQMQKPVDNGRQRHRHRTEEGHPAVQGIKRGKEFPAIRRHIVHRPHTCQYHGGIVEAGNEIVFFTKKSIARRANAERDGNQNCPVGYVPEQPLVEFLWGGHWLIFVLKPHHPDFFL